MIKILLVEDDYDYARLLPTMFSMVDPTFCRLTHVDRLSKALTELSQNVYDIVLLDLSLPDSHGFDTFLQVYLLSSGSGVPIVVLTGMNDEALALRAVREGAQDYLIKDGSDGHMLVRAVQYAIERQYTLAKLQHLSLIDELTGLLNRRGFLSIARQHLKIAHRSKLKLILFFVDLDRLKQINDRFGHPAGDQALRSVADILKETFRSSDVIGRLGGDEFTVLAVDARGGAEVMLARLEAGLKEYNHDVTHLPISLSVGIARFDPEGTASIEDLLAKADQELYAHKHNLQLP